MKWRWTLPDTAARLFFASAVIYLLHTLYRVSTSLTPDFSVLYFASKHLLQSGNPYTNSTLYTLFAYPPVTGLLYILFTFLPYTLAQFIYGIIVIASTAGAAAVAVRIIYGKFAVNTFFVVFALFVFAFPTKFTIGMGQSNTIALFFLLCGYLYRDRKHGICVLCTLFAILLKPVLGFTLLFYLWRREYSVFMSVVVVGLCVLAISVIVYGAKVHLYYLQEVIPHLMATQGREVYYNQGILGFVSRLTADGMLRRYVSGAMIGGVLASLAVLSRRRPSENGALAMLLTALVLIDTLSWQHHFVFLVFPFLYYWHAFYGKEEHTSTAVLYYLSYILLAINVRTPSLVSGPTSVLILSHQFIGAGILYLLIYVHIWREGAEIMR